MKSRIREIAALLFVEQARRQVGLSTGAPGLHMSFTGNPGTGKTTVALRVFDRQDRAHRDGVLPPGVPRVAVEAGVTDLWRKYVGLEGAVVGLDRYGESAPAGDLYRHLGLTAERVVEAVRSVLR